MAVVAVTGNPVVGVKYSVTTASSADWASVANDTYFYDLTDKLVHYKDGSNTVIELFSNGNSNGSTVKSTEIRRGAIAINNTTNVAIYGGLVQIITGSVVAIPFGGITKLPKVRFFTNTAVTNSTVGMAFGIGNNAMVNTLAFGFKFVGSYIYTDQSAGGTEWFVPGARQFCGLSSSPSILGINSGTTVESQINIIGMGSDASDTNLQIFHNDGTGTATKIDLGVNFPANKTGAVLNGVAYQLELYAPYNATSVNYTVTKLSDNTIVTGTINTNLPASATVLGPQIVRTSGATSQNISIDLIQLTASTLY